ncbi:helix-turn-helix transcriptional regulator [Jeotgalibacillus proteolyticus]|nr:helix-turn-helix transcriptional regulator [Jeotgalibacillus proteolyticus]
MKNPIKGLRDRMGINQEELATEIGVDRSYISQMETGKTPITKNVAEDLLYTFDDPALSMQLLHQFSDGVTPVVLGGKGLRSDLLALEQLVVREALELIQNLSDTCFLKPPEYITNDDRDKAKITLEELSDVEVAVANLKMKIATDYNLSLKKVTKGRGLTWKVRGWIS